MFNKNYINTVNIFFNKKLIFFLNIMNFNSINSSNKVSNNISNKNQMANFKVTFNKILLTYNDKNIKKILEINKLVSNSEKENSLKLEFDFNGKKTDLWNLFFFNVRYMRFSILDVLNKKPELKKHFNSLDVLEIFALLINLIFFNDYFKDILTEEEQKFTNENSLLLLSGFFERNIGKKEEEEIINKIKKIIRTILNNMCSKSNIQININGKNISIDTIKKLLQDEDMIKILSFNYLIFLDTLRLFYSTQILSINDESLTAFLNNSKKNAFKNKSTTDKSNKNTDKSNKDEKKDPLELVDIDEEDLS